MKTKNHFKRAVALLLVGLLSLSMLAACGGKDNADATEPGEPVNSESTEPELPEDFVDNTAGLEDMPEEQKVYADKDAQVVIGKQDENVFYNGSGFATMFAANMLSCGTDPDAGEGLPLVRVYDRINYVQLGEHQYKLSDLARTRYDGFDVLKMLAADFGIDQYDPETGELKVCLGTEFESDEALREAYSERADLDNYSICVYYLHADMSGMSDADHKACIQALHDKYGIDHSQLLDGMLAVMLYYDLTGHDMFYTVAISAPGYWSSVEDYTNNMDSAMRHDISRCYMMMDDVIPVGFVNQCFLYCTSDEAMTQTVNSAVNDPNEIQEDARDDGEEAATDETAGETGAEN